MKCFDILVCRTNGGEVVGAECVKTKWKYPDSNIEYEGCANPHNDPRGDWCPTEVDVNDDYVLKSGKWGYCNDVCPKDNGKSIYHYQISILSPYTLRLKSSGKSVC